ncbi:MAG: hypothetical protein HZC45_07605 [Deltaproteobacteria bacterium]|nr:hypothetical protein [Deltaproteobacteria bacterium]
MRWPIIAGDTDLWYHLNSGRYIITNRHLPVDSFFSFIQPPRQWVDYYWLFQVLVYAVYSFFDYYGLVFLRAITYLAAAFLVLCLLLKRQDEDKYIYFLIIFTLCLLFLIPRYTLVRPHTFTYLFILLFIYIFEFQPKRLLYLLPLFSILWFNLHGIEYPVVFLIILSYLAEFFITHIKNREHIKREEYPFIISAVLSLGMIYLTPHGAKLMGVPFVSTAYASVYINEFRQTGLDELLVFEFIKLIPSFDTIFNILFVAICISAVKSIWSKNIRISHLLMLIGGLFLLTKLGRFRYEFLLLSLPVMRNCAFGSSAWLNGKAKIFIMAILLFMSFTYFKNSFGNPPRYPFSNKNLPEGIVTFLNHIKVGGNILNHPNNGGYLQWMLHPKYKIFMDMEVPFFFKDEDFYTADNAFTNEWTLKKVLEKYNPTFISVQIGNKVFKDIIKKFPQYVIIFFDDAEILYINNALHPVLAKEYELKDIDPFGIYGRDVDSVIGKNDINQLKKTISKLLEIYPSSSILNQIMAMIHNKEKDYEKTVTYTNMIIKNYPDVATGYRLKAISINGLNRYSEAISYYKTALKKSDAAAKSGIYREMGLTYMKLKDYKKAYDSLKRGIDIFAYNTGYKDLYDLGSAAFMLGKIDEAVMIYRIAYEKVPLDDIEWREKLENQLKLLGVEMGDV